jgi:PEGA domain-containing protein
VTRSIVALTAVLLVLISSPAGAAPKSEEKVEVARKYFEAGKQAYEAGMFKGAVTAFEEAYQSAPRPQVAFSIAQAYRRQYLIDKDPANAKAAVEYLKRYVAEVPQGGRRADALQFLSELEPIAKRLDSPSPGSIGRGKDEATQIMVSSRTKDANASVDGGPLSEVPLLRDVKPGKHKVHVEASGYFAEDVEELAVENRLAVVELSLREKPSRIMLDAPSGAEVAVNGRPVGTTPFAHAIEVPAGPSLLTVTHRGSYPFARELDLRRDQELRIEAPLETTTQRKIAWWFLGGGAAVAIAGGTAGALAYIAQKDARDKDSAITRKLEMGMNASSADLRAYNDAINRRDHLVTASWVAIIGAVALGSAGMLLYLVDNPRVEEPSLIQKNAAPAAPEMTAPAASISPSVWLASGVVGATCGGRF